MAINNTCFTIKGSSNTTGQILSGGVDLATLFALSANSTYCYAGTPTNNSILPIYGSNTINSNTTCASIAGGTSNIIGPNGNGAFIGGGTLNNVISGCAVVAGGCKNCANGVLAFVGAGYNNCALSQNTVNVGGNTNSVYGTAAFNGGGQSNVVNGNWSVNVGGYNNTLSAAACSFIGGGQNNCIQNALNSAILGGCKNYTCANNTFILGTNLSASVVNYTYVNNLSTQSGNGTICGTFYGDGSNITNLPAAIYQQGPGASSIQPLSGSNTASGSGSNIGGGGSNCLCANACYSHIGGGLSNTNDSCLGVIGGGSNNCILVSYSSIIGGGSGNKIGSGFYSAIVGGSQNYTGGQGNFIGGGASNCNCGVGGCNVIVGGASNCIYNTVSQSVIVGGNSNSLSAGNGYYNFIGSGTTNCIICNTSNTSIIGGRQNTASACYSVILNGYNNINCTTGQYNIIGGCNNNDQGYSCVVILGNGLNASKSNFTYVNNLSTPGSILTQTLTAGSTLTTVPANLPFNFAPITNVAAASGSVFYSVTNLAAGLSSSSDLAAYNDQGNYIDLGINSSKYNGNLYTPKFNIVGPQDSYFYNTSANLAIGTSTAGDVLFFTGGTLSGTAAVGSGNERLRINSGGCTIVQNISAICGTIDNTIIGNTIPAAGCFTNLSGGTICATTGFYGNGANITNITAANGWCYYQCCLNSNLTYNLIGGGNNGICSVRNGQGGPFADYNRCNTIINGSNNNINSASNYICYNFIAGGQNNYTGQCNTFILGSGLSATQNNYTYVNNISSQGAVCGASVCGSTSVCGGALCSTGNINASSCIVASNCVQGGTLISTGNITTTSGNICTSSGNICTSSGNINTITGTVSGASVCSNLVCSTNNIYTTNCIQGSTVCGTSAICGGAGYFSTVNTTGNVAIGGSLTVAGSSYQTNAQSLIVGDPIIYMGLDNTTDLYDIGVMGFYNALSALSASGLPYGGLASGLLRSRSLSGQGINNGDVWTLFNALSVTASVLSAVNVPISNATISTLVANTSGIVYGNTGSKFNGTTTFNTATVTGNLSSGNTWISGTSPVQTLVNTGASPSTYVQNQLFTITAAGGSYITLPTFSLAGLGAPGTIKFLTRGKQASTNYTIAFEMLAHYDDASTNWNYTVTNFVDPNNQLNVVSLSAGSAIDLYLNFSNSNSNNWTINSYGTAISD